VALEAVYTTEVTWTGEHWGRLVMGNGPEMDFSAPPDAHGHAGVLTPEDAFVAAANTCVALMFLWTCERFKIDLVSFRCRTEGTKRVELDRTEMFTHLRFRPEIVVRVGAGDDAGAAERRVRKALAAAQKYSLVANSVKSEIVVEPAITVVRDEGSEPSGGRVGDMGVRVMSLRIKVLGGGCANCHNLEQNVRSAIAALGVDAEIEHVSDPAEYARYGLLFTPGLVVNDKLVSAGRVPAVSECVTLLTNELAAA
jgi:small redox-active disulfide protein 2